MKITNLKNYSYINKNIKITPPNQNQPITCNDSLKTLPGREFYAHFLYQNTAFLGKRFSINDQLEALQNSKIPKRVEKLAIEAANTPNNKKTIYDIHNEAYLPLNDCSTLDEAKALYPEFKDVIDAKDIKITNDMRTLRKIADGEVEGLNLENLTLTFLKKFYAEVAGISTKENWFNLSSKAVTGLADTLNIERLDAKYTRLYSASNPKTRANMKAAAKNYHKNNPDAGKAHSERMKEYYSNPENRKKQKETTAKSWADSEKRAKQSERLKKYYEEHPQEREKCSERMKQYYEDNPDIAKARIEKARETSHSAEAEAKRLKALKEHYKDPKHREQKRQEQLEFHREHPERAELLSKARYLSGAAQVMQEIAQNDGVLGKILSKTRNNIPLTESEEAYRKSYISKCHEIYPDMEKTTGEIYKKLLEEYNNNH